MLVKAVGIFLYGVVVLSLLVLEDNDVLGVARKVFFKSGPIMEEKQEAAEPEETMDTIKNSLNLPLMLVEMIVLCVTIRLLNKYKHNYKKDPLDDLLADSKEALRQTNEFLEKWRMRRINRRLPSEYSNVEVPVLHMAIVDTLRTQPESGDAGDLINISDATILSVTSLLNEDLEAIVERKDSSVEIRNVTEMLDEVNRPKGNTEDRIKYIEQKYKHIWNTPD